MSSSNKKKKKKRSRFGPPKETDSTADVLAVIDSKTKQIDALLAGFDTANNHKKKTKLNFIPTSINKQSSSINTKSPCSISTEHEMVKTITITPTSYKIEHHKEENTATPPLTYIHSSTNTASEPLKLRPLPSPNAKPLKSALKASKCTTFRDEKRAKRRSSDSIKTMENVTKISFDANVKKEDGVSAKFYSSPQYLIRDGSVLRPKPLQQIENEKRLLSMLGAPQELAGRALPPGLLDQDFEEMYDPQIPNDYTSFVNARERLEEWIQIKEVTEQSNFAYQKAMMASQSAEEYIENEIKKEKEMEKSNKRSKHNRSHTKHRDRKRDRDRDRDRRSKYTQSRDRSRSRDQRRESAKNSEFAIKGALPTESPLEGMHCDEEIESNTIRQSGLDKAAKMMAKFGWKRGDGLGKSKQGLKGCLVPVGGYNQLMQQQDPTNVLLLQNMAKKGEVDSHLKTETVEECKQFGAVLDCVVHETEKSVLLEQQVSVFVKFEYIESCMNALQRFNGRFFDGRRVIASFFPTQRFDENDFDN